MLIAQTKVDCTVGTIIVELADEYPFILRVRQVVDVTDDPEMPPVYTAPVIAGQPEVDKQCGMFLGNEDLTRSNVELGRPIVGEKVATGR